MNGVILAEPLGKSATDQIDAARHDIEIGPDNKFLICHDVANATAEVTAFQVLSKLICNIGIKFTQRQCDN
jgi:hypothetical protein